MKRNFTRILAAFALLVFMVPSLVAWGQTVSENDVLWTEPFTGDASSSSTFSETTSWDGYINPTTFVASDATLLSYTSSKAMASISSTATNMNGVHVWLNKSVDSYIQISGIKLYNTTKVKISWAQATSGSSTTVYYQFDGTGDFTALSTCSGPNANFESSELSVANHTTIALKFFHPSSNAKNTRIDNLTLTATEVSGGTPTCATPTFSPAEGTYLEAKNVTISTTTEGAAIYYTINGDDPTTNSSVYSSAITVSATTTIKAMAVKEGCNNSAVASATYTISSLEHAGTAADPYTVADAHTAIDANVGVSEVFATGIVSQIVTAYNSQYSNITFDLVDEEGSSVTLRAYRCEGDEAEDVAVGDIAVVSGNLTLYNGIYEFTQGCTLVSLTHPQAATIILNSTSIDLGNSNETGEQITRTFTVSQLNLTAGITLNLEGNGDIDITSIAMGAEPTTVTWTYTPTEAGNINATITATSAGAEPQTLTITGAAVAPVTGDRYEKVTVAPQDWSGCYIITGTNSGNYYALTGVDSNLGTTAAVTVVGNSIASNTTTDGYQVIVSQTTNGYSLYMDGVGYLYYSGSKNELYASGTFTESTSEWTFSISDNLVTLANVNNTDRKIQFNYNNGNSRFACYASNQVKLTLFKYTGTVVLPPVINVTENTVSLEYDATEGSIAYTIDNPVAGTNLTANSEAEWISNITVADDKVNFTTTVNEGNSDRTATITLSYTGATDKDVTVTQGHHVAPFEPATYTLVTSTSLVSGKTYIIVGENDSDYYAMGEQRSSNRGGVAISVNGTTATVETADVHEVVITALDGDDAGYYSIEDGGYLYAASSSGNQLKTKNELDVNGKWSITIDNGNFSIAADQSDNRNVMQFNYNGNNPTIFSCYALANQSPVYLYVKDETPVTETYTLDITGYTDVTEGNNNKGYYLIASPVTVDPSEVDGMTEGDFDLYYYDQAGDGEGNEWINYEPNVFNLVPGTGYLYAKKATAETPSYSFNLTGAPYTGTGEIPVAAGWNLIGNPFGVEAEISSDYYALTYESNELIATTAATHVAAMQGVFVNADEDDTVIFEAVENNTPGKGQNIALNLSKATRGASTIDRAIVRFDEGQQLPKFQLFENSTKLYIPQGNKDFAIVRSAAQGEMPVNFRASENGTYTLSIETENVEMNYLHLIDNMTGADVDLLATPNYTFEARTNDYTSRFRLVFSAEENGASTDSATFAFFNGTSWTVSNTGDATLQVVDITGRIVSSETINGNATVSLNQPAGIYMLRLVNGNDVKVQKVVVR